MYKSGTNRFYLKLAVITDYGQLGCVVKVTTVTSMSLEYVAF
jgi:hypothetical protein